MKYVLPFIVVGLIVLAGCGAENASTVPDHDHAGVMVKTTKSEAGETLNPEGKTLYTCGMHPHIVQDEPGYCPICGMELTPVRQNTSSEGVVSVDPVTLQNIGVRTAPVTVESLSRSVRTTGRFEANEQALHVVSTRISGWVEKLYVNYEGARVGEGQPLLEIYSPELVATQEEYLLALRNVQRLAGTAAEEDARRLVEAARRRLLYWNITEDQIRHLEASGTPKRTLTLHAPAAGTVTRKEVIEGQQVTAGQTLLELANLSRLWLMVDVYEQDLSWVDVGTRARVELPYAPGQEIAGRVDYLYDVLDPETRTVRARIEVSNPDLALKPGMYATATLYGADTPPAPAVPEEALLRTGERELVILALGEGRFRPVEVTAGLEAGGKVQILEGLQGGEQVVTSAQFLIDSEARLKSAIGAMTSGHDHASMSGASSMTDSGPSGVTTMLVDVHAADEDGDGYVYLCLDQPHLLQDGPDPIPNCSGSVERVSVGAAQAVLHESGYANVPVNVEAADRNRDGVVFQSPMHWSVIKDEPGQCDVCGMYLKEVTIDEAKRNLQQAGYHIHHP